MAATQRPVAPLNLRVSDAAFVPLQLEAERAGAQSMALQAVTLQLPVRLANGALG